MNEIIFKIWKQFLSVHHLNFQTINLCKFQATKYLRKKVDINRNILYLKEMTNPIPILKKKNVTHQVKMLVNFQNRKFHLFIFKSAPTFNIFTKSNYKWNETLKKLACQNGGYSDITSILNCEIILLAYYSFSTETLDLNQSKVSFHRMCVIWL